MRPDLRAFRELRVTDPALSTDASASRYVFVDRGGKRHEVALRWKFDAPLYADAEWTMRNQARVHHAIASLNYGLFCDRIVYEFPLTRDDLAYLRAMERVTAREQYLTRFVGDAPHVLIESDYHVPTEAFEPDAVDDVADLVADEEEARPRAPATDPERYAVLSSGGKESLLTYGLLRELGQDVSPVYVNESGRHWHTALLSYRHHAATEPRTRRVWTTVDRLYNFANRLLPCVKPDHHRIGADVYPTQLFTFNAYQMAVAGLCMHERIGTMLMGNEFDEGPWPAVKGVTYWHGIYDQSQEFDLVLNDYFAAKRWGLRQTSLLRPLSGILIEDMLASRYPDLLETQTSCHATHMRDGRPAPCGRCSKCVGILLLLAANGHDARRLRYTPDDVDQLAGRIAAHEIKIERPEAEHAMWMASRHGWRFRGSAMGYEPRPHPEVASIRFHPEMARRDSLPEPLADRLLRIYGEHATGVLERRGDRWVAASPTP